MLRSGWITTGPTTKRFEQQLRAFTGASGVACLASATAAFEVLLRILGVGPGDEVVVPAYTYTATASPVCHVGATLVLCDVAPNTVKLDTAKLARAIGPRTKVVVGVDVGGVVEDYDAIRAAVDAAAPAFAPASPLQEAMGRIAIVADAAHSLGALKDGRQSGSVADFTFFSFHAVKNLTTAEGGALAWRDPGAWGYGDDELYRQAMLHSLHGQTRDALAKTRAGAWEYDIAFAGHKCNMTDIQAALGLAQLQRFEGMLERRRALVGLYAQHLQGLEVWMMPHLPGNDGSTQSSCHLLIARLNHAAQEERNRVIEHMAGAGVAANVHYKPLPLLTAYRNLGFAPEDYPCALDFFGNEITLPLHTLMSDDDVAYVCTCLKHALDAVGVGR